MGSRTLFPLIRAVQDVEFPIRYRRGQIRLVFRRLRHRPKRFEEALEVDRQHTRRSAPELSDRHATVLMNRWEQIAKGQSRARPSYGFSFEDNTTVPAPGCERGTGYHRIITYASLLIIAPRIMGLDHLCNQDFDGLKMVVRFEVDACLPSDRPGPKAAQDPPADDDDDPEVALLGVFSGLAIGAGSQSTTMPSLSPLTSADLKIFRAGNSSPSIRPGRIDDSLRNLRGKSRLDRSVSPAVPLPNTPSLPRPPPQWHVLHNREAQGRSERSRRDR